MGMIASMQPRYWALAAAIWGFAEATAFFIVPDILLTASILVGGTIFALRLAGIAAVAAMVGGLGMYFWSASDAGAAREMVLAVPLIAPDLIARVATEIDGAWPVNLFLGALSGAPYKIYAVEAGASGVNAAAFAVVSVAARFARFAIAIGFASAGFTLANRLGLAKLRAPGLFLVWAAIYAFYMSIRLGAA